MPLGADPTGEVAAGSVTVTGLVIECLLGRASKDCHHGFYERVIHKGQMVCRMICDSGKDEDNGPEGLPVYTLLVRTESGDPYSNDPPPFHALVLRRSRGFGGKAEADDAFERIGIIQYVKIWNPITTSTLVRWEQWFDGAERKTIAIV